MISEALKNKVSSPGQSIKVRAVITASSAGAVVYYCRPSVYSKLLLPKITLLTNTETAGKKVTISKTTITDPDMLFDTIQAATSPTITASDVSNSSQYDYTMPNAALTQTLFQPVASNGITDALLTCDPDGTGNAIKISIAQLTGGKAMTGVLELEFLPV